MNYIQYMKPGGTAITQEGTLRVDPQTNRTQTYRNGQWKDNVITTPWSSQETVRMNNGRQEVYLDGEWRQLREPKWYEKLNEEDWYTLGSIAGDLASLGLSFTGFSPAAAATGAISTTSQLIGDIKRDGFQAKDLGWAALGYGLDAISLVPLAGVAAQAAKAAPKLAKAAPIVLGLGTAALSGLGIGTSIPAFKKVVNGEKLTMDDYRLMTNALMSIVGLGRQARGLYDNAAEVTATPTISKQETPAEMAARLKKETQSRLELQEQKLNERYQQIAEASDNWKFKLAQMSSNVQMNNKAKMFEQTGDPKAWKHAIVKKSPIGISNPNPMLDHILLINRVGGDGQILWQNGQLVWPRRKEMVEGVQERRYNSNRPTVHFTTHKPVTDHGYGTWSETPTTIMIPITEVMKSNGRPLSIEPMDTYWNNSLSMQIPAAAVRVFTGSLQEATKARMQGASVTFSKEAYKINKEIQKLNKQYDDIMKKHAGDFSGWQKDPKRYEIEEALRQLQEKNYNLHTLFTDQQQASRPLTVEDYRLLEAVTGLQSGVSVNANGELSYYHTPHKHSFEWWKNYSENGIGSVKETLDIYIDKMTKHLKKPPLFADAYEKQMFQNEIDAWSDWAKTEGLSDEQLLILQQTVAKASPKDLERLKKLASILPDDYPNIEKLRGIANGELVYRYYSGGKLNYLNLIGNGR